MNVREWALPVYTILMELATGAFFVIWLVRSLSISKYGREKIDCVFENSILVIFITIGAGMVGAHFHLSKPYLSFISVLNIRSSWLSREILFTVLYFLSIGLLWTIQRRRMDMPRLKAVLGWIAIFFSWTNLYCMAKIYILPTQASWNTSLTTISFTGTAFLVGIMALITLMIMDLRYSESHDPEKASLQELLINKSLLWIVVVESLVAALLISANLYQIHNLRNSSLPTAQASVTLLLEVYPMLFILRLALILIGVGGFALVVLLNARNQKPVRDLLSPIYATCLVVVIGEILGRFLFYAVHIRTGI
ncbi:MAG: dimethyl sulfoxide reductase anchor subunit [Anaerolineales bacterium]|jgi:anaerobic dimethyl sulfoxide reductase subunit C (anchor subunit)